MKSHQRAIQGGRILGTDFEIEELIAATNVSRVYSVRSSSIGRKFCAKVIPRGEEARRWKREISVLAELSHPNIIKLFRVLELEDEIVLIFDWARGESLDVLVERGETLTPGDVKKLTLDLASALQAVHEKGVVHRDIKPSNVMIDRLPSGDLSATLLDFGIAKPLSDSRHTTGFVGSPFYASPEQIREELVDVRTDIYQLGCVVFFALTGEPPFAHLDAVSVMNSHLYQPAPRASDKLSKLRRMPIDDLVLRMLEKAPEHRPQSCSEVLETLRGRARAPRAVRALPQSDASISAVGPNSSVITASGTHMTVATQSGAISHFDLDDTISAIHPDVGVVYYGTGSGEVRRLDLASGTTSTIVNIPRAESITGLAKMRDTLVVADSSGALSLVSEDGSYRVVRCDRGEQCPPPVAVAAASKNDCFAVLREPRSLQIFHGLGPARSDNIALDFDADCLAVSPDGYVVAVLGHGVTWIINALDGSVIHRIRSESRAASMTFLGGTLLGIERTPSGGHEFFELY